MGSTRKEITFQTLISAIQSPKGLNVAFLKRLYLLLLASLPLNQEMRCCNLEATFDDCGLQVQFKDVQSLKNALYRDLYRRFELLFADYYHVSGIRGVQEQIEEADHELLHLLLRCCMLVLTSDDPMLQQRIQFLLSLLRRLMAPVATSGTDEKNCVRFRNFVSSICPVLEIFADELLKGRFLRHYFIMVDSTACATEMLFRSQHYVGRDIASVLEVISVHFISSVYCSDNFLKRLSCGVGNHSRVPELSLTAAMSLLLNPIMLSAPKMLHAGLILLVSEAIDVNMSTKNATPDLRLMECYQGALERSIELYTSHMTSSLVDSHTMGGRRSNVSSTTVRSSCQPSFESYIQQVTKDKIHECTNSDSLPDCSMICVTKAGIMAATTAYINESQHMYDESCKEDIFAVLNSIMRVSFSSDAGDAFLYRNGKTSLQDIYFLGSILKLMSTSFLSTIWCIRHGGNLGCPKTLKDASSKEYDQLVGTISCFRQFNLSLPNQKCLFDMMKTRLLTHKTSKWMLLHFSGLLSLSFATGIDFLVKGCISTIMASLNLYVFEEGGIAELRSLLVSGSQTFSSGLSSEKVIEAVAVKKSIARVALKFQKVHALHSSTLPDTEESSDGIKETEETCDGKIFLTCILDGSQQSDIDDLADFIECRPCKDYSLWWKKRQRYLGVKHQRRERQRLERKKNAWKSIIGMHHSRSGNIMLGKKH